MKKSEYKPLLNSFQSMNREKRKVKHKQLIIRICVTSLIFGLFLIIMALIINISVITDAPVECQPNPILKTAQSIYKYSAVASDAVPCESVANNIMSVSGGNAVDAAVAGILCSCVVNIHSCGLTGGTFLIIYIRKENRSYAVDLREEAPAQATEDMFVKNSTLSSKGGLSIGVPGLVSGLYEVWKKLGSKNNKLSWMELVQPSIEVAENGFRVSESLYGGIMAMFLNNKNEEFTELRNFLTNPKTGNFYRIGDVLRQPKLANTLRILAKEPYAIKNGSLTAIVADEIKEAGGIITADDLAKYKPKWRTPVVVKLTDGTRLHTLPPPCSGALISFAVNVLSEYKWSNKQLDSCGDAGLFFHRFIETLKFAFAERSALGDEDYVNVTEILRNLTSRSYAHYIRSRIQDDGTHSVPYYHPKFEVPTDHGTSHFSLVSPEGDAVSATSTINYLFGSLVMGNQTGLIYNDEMDDFSTPNSSNKYHIPPSPSNFIKAGKRPMSSMSPIILVDGSEVKSVIGASGGSKIISAVAQVTTMTHLLNSSIKMAIDYPRLHHQLIPDYLYYGPRTPKIILDELKMRKHKVRPMSETGSVVQGILQTQLDLNMTMYQCNADYRKMGLCDGS